MCIRDRGGLTAAGGADQSQPLACLDVQTDMVEHLVVVVRVLKADIVKADGTGAGLQGEKESGKN